MKIDDSLDVFAVHGVGGILGTLLLSVFGLPAFGGSGVASVGGQLTTQLIAILAVVAWSALATYLIILVCRFTIGLRVSSEDEITGLDQSEHGETAYHFE